MSEKICAASYAQGRKAFIEGAPLLSIIEQVNAAEGPLGEMKAMSLAIGFADGVLDHIRHPLVIATQKLAE